MYDSLKNSSSPLFKLSADTYEDFWAHQAERHREHERSITVILSVIALLCVLSFVVHPNLMVFAAALVPFLLVEVAMYRRTRPVGKLPEIRRRPD